MKTYTLKIMLRVKANSDLEVKRECQNFIKELPRMDGLTIEQASLYSIEQKKVIEEDVR